MGVPQALTHKKTFPPLFLSPKKKEKKGTRRYLPRSDERRRDTFLWRLFSPHILCCSVCFLGRGNGKKRMFFSEYPVIICRYSWTKKRGIKGERPFIDALSLSLCQSGNEEKKASKVTLTSLSLPSITAVKLFQVGGGRIVPTSYFPLFHLSQCPPNQPFYYQRKMQKLFLRETLKKIRDDDDCRFPIACCKKIEVKRNSEIFSPFFRQSESCPHPHPQSGK